MHPDPVTQNLAFPDQVGKYRLLLPLGTGGMATVYLARASGVGGFERDVALKLIHAHLRSDEDTKLQLLDEARLAARIRHPNVVPVLEVDEDPSGLFLVMEYVEGDTLSGLVRGVGKLNQTLDPPLIARILNDALLGLHAAHELTDSTGAPLGLVHRDFSPQNILLSIEGVTRLSDFGVAKAANRAVRTKTGLTKGKISYMSPEQARGKAIDRRSDVWAAGVVLWELLAGRRMHQGEDDVSTLLTLVTECPPRLSSVVDVPPAIDEVVARALEPEVNLRHPTAEAFRVALEKAWHESGYVLATREALADTVRRIAGGMLADRRRLAEAAAQRRDGAPRLALSRPLDPADEATATLPSAPAGAPVQEPATRWVLPPDEGTETSAVLPAVPHRKTPALSYLLITSAVLAVLAWAVVSLKSDGESPPPPSTAGEGLDAMEPEEADDGPKAPAAAEEPTARPAEPASPPAATSAPKGAAATRPNQEKSPASRGASRPATKKAAKRPPAAPPSQAAPTQRKPGLASSPYDAPKSDP